MSGDTALSEGQGAPPPATTTARVAGQRRARRILGKATRFAQGLIVLTIFVIGWEIASRAGLVHNQLVPAPSRVFLTWVDWIFGLEDGLAGRYYSGTWVEHTLTSGRRVLYGFGVAAVVGVVAGILIGWFSILEALFDPVVQLLRPIPVTAWVPFTIIIFGLHEAGAYFLIALGAFFPIVVNTTAGAQRAPRLLVHAALMLGTKPRQLLWRVVIPASLPYIFTGLRLGIGVAWVLLIVAEMLAVRSGLGFVMWNAYQHLRMDMIVATMASVGLLGFVSDWLIVRARRHFLAWSDGLFN